MSENFILFDLDDVLLSSQGYPRALQSSVDMIGSFLGFRKFEITNDQIAKFQVRNVTNEWDIVAICTALLLIHCWKKDGSIRLPVDSKPPNALFESAPDIDAFLETFTRGNDLPSLTAYTILTKLNKWLSDIQVSYLYEILSTCRDIYESPTLPIHQEFILGSELFQRHYNINPKSTIDGYLQKYDQALLNSQNHQSLKRWLKIPGNYAGIMTNRQSKSPCGYLGSPEAEIGIKQAGLTGFPYIASGLLSWFAVTELQLPGHSLLKPNPVHALSLMQLLKGENFKMALRTSSKLWKGESTPADWIIFNDARITVYEDSVKGFLSAKAAQTLLSKLGIGIELKLIGVSQNPIKIKALNDITPNVINNINETSWPETER